MATTIKKLNKLTVVILGLALLAPSVELSPVDERNSTTTGGAAQEQLVSDDAESLFLGLYNMFGGGNPKSTPDGRQLVEGDMVLPESSTEIGPRKAVPDSSLYWPNGEIIYTYHESITQGEMYVIEAAIQHWQKHTCLTFRRRHQGDYAFIRFRSDTQGCWSLVGRQVNSPNGYGNGQDVSIGQGCANLNVVVHEIGHVIGFFHEQSRSDRDSYINIVWENVLPGYSLQFRKEHDQNYGIPYDLTSTMQYPQWAFSKEIFEKSTIVARNPAYQRFLNKNYPLSFRDRLLANRMYQCTARCSQSAGGSCQNGGYMRATGASHSCSCDCPPNFTGSHCETAIRSDYYEELPCGGQVTRPGRIQTPGYPQRTGPYQSCMWDIQAPAGHRVQIRFNGFEFAPRFTKPGTKVINKCFNETVEIRLRNGNIYDGDTYCGTDLAPGTVMRSDGPKAVIIITANDKMMGRGLSASVRFFRDGIQLPDNEGDDEDNEIATGDQVKPTTSAPEPTTTTSISDTTITTGGPQVITTPTSIFTLKPPTFTLPPILRPRPPPPPPSVTTVSSLLEEYEKESKKTFPPVGPFY